MSYKEGDVWVERGKTWTIKNGIKKTVTKFSDSRKKLHTPLSCPKCSKSLSHWLDEKMFKFNGCCHDCTIEFEHELLKQGKFAEYQKSRVSANVKSYVQDLEVLVKEFIQTNDNQNLVTEDGDVESWEGNAGKRMKEIAEPILNELKQITSDK